MGFLDSFELVRDQNELFITVRERTITFSKVAIEALKFTPNIHMYINRERKILAFQQAEKDENSIPFYHKPKEGCPVLVRISDKKKAKLILNLSEQETSEKGIRFFGQLIEEENLIYFDLTKGLQL